MVLRCGTGGVQNIREKKEDKKENKGHANTNHTYEVVRDLGLLATSIDYVRNKVLVDGREE
jgi:hypothetical protein